MTDLVRTAVKQYREQCERDAGGGSDPGSAPAANIRPLAGRRRARGADPGAGGVGGGALRLLLDSVILIDHFNGRLEATRYLARSAATSALSVITRAEVLAGFDSADAAVAVRLLDRFPTLGIDVAVADLAAHLRREHRWKMPDALQAALARYHGLTSRRGTRATSRRRPSVRGDPLCAPPCTQ